MKKFVHTETSSRMKKWFLTTFGGQTVHCVRRTPRFGAGGGLVYSRSWVLVPAE